MLFIILYLLVKNAIQSNSGDLSAAEAECARIGAEADALRHRASETVSASQRKGQGKLVRTRRTLSWPPCKSGFRRLASRCSNCSRRCGHRLQQKVFRTYVKGTLVNLTRDAATDSAEGLRDIRQRNTCKLDTRCGHRLRRMSSGLTSRGHLST